MNEEKKRILKTAATLIKTELREINSNPAVYPSVLDAQCTDWIPDSLRFFLSHFTSSKLKIESIGQCIVKAALPRSVLPPIMFALAVELDLVFGSKWLIDQTNKLGFSESYHEVTRFKQGVVLSEDVDELIDAHTSQDEDEFVTFVADNVDDDTITLDGKGTFHGMGVLAIITNKTQSKKKILPIRPKKLVKVDQLVKEKGIPILSYDLPNQRGLDSVIFKPYEELLSAVLAPTEFSYDALWQAAGLFSSADEPRPNWNGFMQEIITGQHPPKSKTVMLPIIDLDPKNESCVYSVLKFIISQSKRLGVKTPTVTFDQQLWIIALEIIAANKLDIVPLLGGFHMLMSFYGSIGSIMEGSGIRKLFKTIYGENTTKHIMSGKATARANRAHIIAESALMTKILETVLEDEDVDIQKVLQIYKSVITKENILDTETLENLSKAVKSKKDELSRKSRTAKLWINYMNYVEVCRNFIRAARTGDWSLHLHSVSQMTNIFAATGHHNYAKSARIYLQQMMELPTKHPWLYKKFSEEGLFVARRSDRYWAGLWLDLTIEQIMMRSLKSTGGLTRGSGFTESVRTMWIYSLHASGGYHEALCSLTKNVRNTSFQHDDFGKGRLQRDFSDLEKAVKNWLNMPSHNPFDQNRTTLQALDSGLTADEKVNCDEAEEVGKKIQKKLDGSSWTVATVKRSEKAVTLVSLKPTIRIANETVVVDPLVLFSRLIILMSRFGDISGFFSFELAPVPTSLFKDNFMRKPNKASLSHALDKIYTKSVEGNLIQEIEDEIEESDDEDDLNSSQPAAIESNHHHVIDGGYLLRRVVWDNDVTFRELIQRYMRYVRVRFQQEQSTIVFDGKPDGP